MFGNPETTTGGRALKFYTSVRLEVRKSTAIKDGNDFTGTRTTVKVVKNKVAPPFKKTEFDIMYGKGISYIGDVLDLAVAYNIVEKSGSWYSYSKEKIGQGRENAKLFLEEHNDVLKTIADEVKDALGIGKKPVEKQVEESE
jgi:recombination protein RecA